MSAPQQQTPPYAPPPPSWAPPPMAMPKQRPLGVTILAILAILGGILALIVGLLALVVFSVVATLLPPELQGVAGVLVILSAIAALFGLLWIVGGIGLWRLRPWGWWLAIIASVFQLISGAAQAATPLGPSWFSIGLGLIILFYLVVVSQHFGIGAAPQPAMPQPPSM